MYLTFQATKKSNKPKKAAVAVPLKKGSAHSLKVLKKIASTPFYRADLTSAASARYSKLNQAQRVKNNIIKGLKIKNGRK